MHFALPPRKTSHPPPYARSSRTTTRRRKQLQSAAIVSCAALFLLFLISRFMSGSSDRPPLGTPQSVIVTVLDESVMTKEYMDRIKENRRDYATRHGYTTFFANAADYELNGAPRSWAVIPATRHAMAVHPHSTYFLSLSPHALIMTPNLQLTSHVMAPKRIESLMLKDKPVVPPDSVIKTFSHLRGHSIDLVLTQDGEGLCQGSFVIRQGEWARYFLDSWFDPLYRTYNFQKAEGHALEHVVQWHPTVLTRLAIVPQTIMNSYGVNIPSRGGKEVMYKDDDFIVSFPGCDADQSRNCEEEMEPYYKRWKAAVDKVN